MPTLDWIGKKAVLSHHREVPYRLLQADSALSAGDPSSANLLVQGDNLLALKALLPYYAGKVECVYIDPPYNTGNEGWVYNDAVNSPEIRKWLGRAVGAEAEDLSRHDKWLCMMYPRLSLLREFLTADGILLVSIDDNEVHSLRTLLDELFGVRRHLATLVWKSRHFTDTRPLTGISSDHEYILVYGNGPSARFRGKRKDFSKYSNPDNDLRGPWTSCSLLGKATKEQRPNLHYDFHDPVTGAVFPCPTRTGWICAPGTMESYAREGRLLYPKREGGRLRVKVFQAELKSQYMGFPSVITEFSTSDGTLELRALLGDQVFGFPKPSALIAELLEQATDPGATVLDSFAGSGTTGHAVMRLNRTDGGDRRFVLVEMEPQICEQVAAERLRRVIGGYQYTNHRGAVVEVDGLGGGFRFCRLGEPLFDEGGAIRPTVEFPVLAAHVYFTETGTPISEQPAGQTPLLGVHLGTAVYLLFNGVLGDRRPDGGNVLTSAILHGLPRFDGRRVIYGEGCRLSAARLRREGIIFKQIPYEIRVS
jgi:adenine-specific DNA-methyltransferase